MKLRLLFSLLFSAVLFTANSQSVGIIGSATANGWASDTNMVNANPDSTHLWSLTLPLVIGEVKFRQNDDWAVNWGAGDFPSGVGTQGGANIPIPAAAVYTVTFNSTTGAYSFAWASRIGIIGDATPGGWNDDTNMFQDPVDTNQYFLTLNLGLGKVKFRQDDSWNVNWGGGDFPSDTAIAPGSDIPIPAAGKYLVKFNDSTLLYSFEEIIAFTAISLTGDATPGGWAADTDLTKDAGNPDLWRADITLTDGEAKFRANHAWAINWGDTLFPAGIGIPGGPNIKCLAGDYKVSFNTKTAEYKFLKVVPYTSIGIIGDATPGGWANETALEQDTTDKAIWRKRLILTAGEAKFRANNDWTVNWGSGDFPAGTGTQDGANIPVTAGEYKITFNSVTGEYNFELLVVYNIIGLIGNSIPGNNWDVDVLMTKSANDEFMFFIQSIDLLDAPVDGGVKFRANNAWAVNWGTLAWPTGVGTQDGHNIEPVAGTYGVTFNTATGEFAFGDPITDTKNLLTADAISLSPNPTSDFVNIAISNENLRGDVSLTVFNQAGQRVLTQTMTINESAKLDVSGLGSGNYLVQVTNGKFMVGKKISIVK